MMIERNSYRYYTIGVVAALNAWVAQEWGYQVLTEPWQRERIPAGRRQWRIPLATELHMDPPDLDRLFDGPATEVEMEFDSADLKKLAWVHPHYGAAYHAIWIGAAEEAKILVWWSPAAA